MNASLETRAVAPGYHAAHLTGEEAIQFDAGTRKTAKRAAGRRLRRSTGRILSHYNPRTTD